MVTIKGQIKDKTTSEKLSYASVYLSKMNGDIREENLGTQTDDQGNYEIELPFNSGHISVKYLGYKLLTKPFSLANKTVNFELEPTATGLGTVEIIGHKEEGKTGQKKKSWYLWASFGIGISALIKGLFGR